MDKSNLKNFLYFFVLAFIINVFVIFLWELILHGEGKFNPELSLVLGLAIGIVFSVYDSKK